METELRAMVAMGYLTVANFWMLADIVEVPIGHVSGVATMVSTVAWCTMRAECATVTDPRVQGAMAWLTVVKLSTIAACVEAMGQPADQFATHLQGRHNAIVLPCGSPPAWVLEGLLTATAVTRRRLRHSWMHWIVGRKVEAY
jgi:hypothetical protein